MTLSVSLAATEEEQKEVYRFRYRVYVDELNLMPAEADHENHQLKDELDDISFNYALYDDEEIVGSLRLLFFDDVDDQQSLIKKYNCQQALEAFGPEAMCATSRFMLSPHFRGGRIIFKLMEAAYREACNKGARFNFGDCSPHILSFYEHLGYRRYTNAYNDSSYGYKLPILMLIRDQEYFKRVRSPLARLAKEFADDSELRLWFENSFPDFLEMETASFLSEDRFFDLLSAKVGSDPLHSLSLLNDLERQEADSVLKMATLIQCKDGDQIIRQGERDKTLYVLLSGVAEVILEESPRQAVTILAAGDTFGEIGLVADTPRTATVIARSDCEVLVLSGDFLKTCIRKEPVIAAKLFANLSKMLAEKLSSTTAMLSQSMI